jgi:hypothetical protein
VFNPWDTSIYISRKSRFVSQRFASWTCVLTLSLCVGAPSLADHWAFRSPSRPEIPDVENSRWCRNPIDAFVLDRLRAEGLSPSPVTPRDRLIRRLSLDLTGLPPIPEEVLAFLNDEDPRAYEKVVDRLLASPKYGERMALAWMDAARYGDTSALNADGVREMWPWRDWVIAAYNRNMPFDDFLIQQLAGDLLPNPTVDQLIATGFNRNNGTSDENGADAEELRINYVIDRVQTTFNIFQGLSVECAQCHDHKYDPISQEEYYGVFAFFNSARDPGLQTREGNQRPLVHLPAGEAVQQIKRIQRKMVDSQHRFASIDPSPSEVTAWIEQVRRSGDWFVASDLFVLGDFCDGTLAHVLKSEQFQPQDASPELTSTAGAFSWRALPDWIDGEPNRTWMTRSSARYYYRRIEADKPHDLQVTLSGADAFRVWLNGEKLKTGGTQKQSDTLNLSLLLRSGDNHLIIKAGARKNGHLNFLFSFNRSLYPIEVERALSTEASCESGAELLANYYRHRVWERSGDFRQEQQSLVTERDALLAETASSMVMGDRDQPRPTYVLMRGEYDAPDTSHPILPGVPAIFPGFPEAAPQNRLGLAQWMVSSEHPLTPRVAVNRYWALLFGSGIVRTPTDFGVQGEAPTHPRLLDWLACDFVAGGWNVKRVIKQIVMSATYQQSSRSAPELLSRDPANRLLARQTPFRLAAESIRDQALAVSGLLVDSIGGPSVKPYQPDGLWKSVSDGGTLVYVPDTGDKLYRRGMYVYWKRSAPHPSLTTFDTPSRETCQIGRIETNTPLQALVLLNDNTYVEAARFLAERMLAGGTDFNSRVQRGYRLCTSRLADPQELEILAGIYRRQLEAFGSDKERAVEFLGHGEAPRDESIDAVTHAAWTVLAQVLLNLDEVINRE